MARNAGGVDFRISRVNRIASGSMTPGALGSHRHPASVIDRSMIIHKGAMAGGTISAAVAATYGRAILTGSSTQQTTIGVMA